MPSIIAATLPQQRVLLDTGAAVHVCPRHYAPNCPKLPTPPGHPQLRTVTGEIMQLYGMKYVTYLMDTDIKITVKYIIADSPLQVL